ncbi:hypothetical protein BN12_4060022 [Nostocoides japonicum T1-X7]|uniref:Uncharacterized protein n=1 Tax=Nostocoides japonicum T1-X7 TaxID=1194083 RepID=A0A077M2H9_9MICO|nr:hypothetical protein BN12_4060022 [Tetrasphaera japonica T1-X7]
MVPMFTSSRSSREGPGYTPAVSTPPADSRGGLPLRPDAAGDGSLLIERARLAPQSRPISTRFENGSG